MSHKHVFKTVVYAQTQQPNFLCTFVYEIDPPKFMNSVSSKTIQDPYFYYHQHPVSSLLSCRSKFCRRDHYKIQNILSPLIRGDSRYFLFLTKFFFSHFLTYRSQATYSLCPFNVPPFTLFSLSDYSQVR